MKRKLALLATLLLTPACDGESISSMLDEFVEHLDTQADIICDCWNEWGYSSRQSCTGTESILPSIRRCLEGSLSQDETAATEWLRCRNTLEAEYSTCIDNRLVCASPSTANGCIDDFNLGLGECIGLPPSIQRDLDDCFASGGGGGEGDGGDGGEADG
ncbi:MAG: hypothetical protein ACPG4T_09590 [Nannocystaceae bacterium]